MSLTDEFFIGENFDLRQSYPRTEPDDQQLRVEAVPEMFLVRTQNKMRHLSCQFFQAQQVP